MRALVCDDDATVRLIARRVLEDHFGCTVVECENGVEALALLAETHCSFAILDVDMPVMGGLETLEEIRASEALYDLPVVILTAERDESTVVTLLQQGVSDYIVKPLRHSNFVAKVEALVQSLPDHETALEACVVPVGERCSVLIADGDADFRAVFAKHVEAFADVVHAESGAAALVAFRQAPARIVVIGSKLGVMSPERVAIRMREANPRGVRLIRIVEQAAEPAGEPFDRALLRSSSPDVIRAVLQSCVVLPAA